jgi:hypothetical protein
MAGFAVGFLLVAFGFLLGYAVRGLTAEQRLRERFIADLEKLKADAEGRERALSSALVKLHEMMVEITRDEIECAQSEDGFAVKGWIKRIRAKYEEVDALLEDPAHSSRQWRPE